MSFKPITDRIEYGGALIGQEEEDAIMAVIRNQGRRRWTIGPESTAFEKELAEKTGVKYATVVNSGSSALLVAITALKLPKGSKVIIPALNFPTAYSSLLFNGLTPVVVDCDLATLNISFPEVEKALKQHPDVKAVVAVHIAGNIVDLPRLREIVGDRLIIGDNCDGYGGSLVDNDSEDWKGLRYIDAFADVSCVSFHAAHIICTGEGGAVLTNNQEIGTRARKMREWGRASGSDTLTNQPGFPEDYRERYVFEEIGFNMKPLELQCAMGRVQLKKLERFKKSRQEHYEMLLEIFKKHTDLFSPVENYTIGAESCWFAFPFLVKENRGKFMDYLESKNIETRTVFSGNILRHPAYKGTGIQIGELENSNYVMEHGMFIGTPPDPIMTDEMIDYIGEVIKEL